MEHLEISALDALLENESDPIACMANTAAWLFHSMNDVSWVGFYLLKNGELVLGPFQGKVACTRIALHRGVCGAAFTGNCIVRVDNVHEFLDHIACDEDSRSEIVLPLRDGSGDPFGVLDIDSATYSRFSELEAQMLWQVAEHVAAILAQQRSGSTCCSQKT